MTEMNDSDEFDQIMIRALRGRPEPAPIPDLAERAVLRGRAQHLARELEVRNLLVRQRRLVQIVSCAAVILIGLVLWLGARHWIKIYPSSDSTLSSSTISSSDDTAATSTSSSVFSSLGIATVGGCVLAGVLVLMAPESVFAEGNSIQPRPSFY